jgi:HSP20 family protein
MFARLTTDDRRDLWTDLIQQHRQAGHHGSRLDVHETNESYFLAADVPGFSSEDLDISIEGRKLTIEGATSEFRTDVIDASAFRAQRRRPFARTIRLPKAVDEAKVLAEVKEGVLTITLPKVPALQATKIQVH